MAATLAQGEVLASDRSAGDLLGLVEATSPLIHVVVVGGHGYSRPGIRAHRVGRLAPAERTIAQGVPCTSVARTLLDLAARSPRRILDRAIEHAEKLGMFDLEQVNAVCGRTPGHHGTGALRAALVGYVEPAGTRHELERRFLELVVRARLPVPECNVWLPEPALEADFLWRDARVAVETDSREHHLTTRALQRDRERDRLYQLHHYAPLRYAWFDVTRTAQRTVTELRAMVSR